MGEVVTCYYVICDDGGPHNCSGLLMHIAKSSNIIHINKLIVQRSGFGVDI